MVELDMVLSTIQQTYYQDKLPIKGLVRQFCVQHIDQQLNIIASNKSLDLIKAGWDFKKVTALLARFQDNDERIDPLRASTNNIEYHGLKYHQENGESIATQQKCNVKQVITLSGSEKWNDLKNYLKEIMIVQQFINQAKKGQDIDNAGVELVREFLALKKPLPYEDDIIPNEIQARFQHLSRYYLRLSDCLSSGGLRWVLGVVGVEIKDLLEHPNISIASLELLRINQPRVELLTLKKAEFKVTDLLVIHLPINQLQYILSNAKEIAEWVQESPQEKDSRIKKVLNYDYIQGVDMLYTLKQEAKKSKPTASPVVIESNIVQADMLPAKSSTNTTENSLKKDKEHFLKKIINIISKELKKPLVEKGDLKKAIVDKISKDKNSKLLPSIVADAQKLSSFDEKAFRKHIGLQSINLLEKAFNIIISYILRLLGKHSQPESTPTSPTVTEEDALKAVFLCLSPQQLLNISEKPSSNRNI
jgi:hypothetical protein